MFSAITFASRAVAMNTGQDPKPESNGPAGLPQTAERRTIQMKQIKPAFILGAVMILVITATGVLSLATDAFAVALPHPQNYLFGGVLLLYAVVRYSRLRRQINSDRHNK
jgi:hypothetical protein